MPYYKDKSNKLHFIDDASFKSLLPEGSVEISDAEAQAILKPPLDEEKKTMWDLIQAERDRRKFDGVLVDTYWIHSDADSRTQHLGLVLLGENLSPGLWWKTMGGEFVEMTPTLAKSIVCAVAQSDQAIFAVAEMHKKAMTESQNPSSYDFSQGWPQTHGDIKK